MGKPVSITVSHELCREGALARIRDGVTRIREQIGRFGMTLVEEEWDGDNFAFGVAVLGYTVRGRLEVEDTLVRVVMTLPWMLAAFAEKLKARVETQGSILLEKPKA